MITVLLKGHSKVWKGNSISLAETLRDVSVSNYIFLFIQKKEHQHNCISLFAYQPIPTFFFSLTKFFHSNTVFFCQKFRKKANSKSIRIIISKPVMQIK